MPVRLSASRRWFLALLLLGALARVVAFPLPGTGDLRVYSVWMHFTTTHAPTAVYGVGGWPPIRQMMTFDGVDAAVDYPPAGIYLLSAFGRAWRAVTGNFESLRSVTDAVKVLSIIASASLTVLIWFVIRRRGGDGKIASAAFWVNPAVILHGAVLGYFGNLAALPAIAAIFAADHERPWLAGALLAVGILTKPQAVLVLPAVLLALLASKDRSRAHLAAASTGGALAAAVLLAPFWIAGSLPNLVMSVAGLVTDGYLSAQAANVWWIAGYAVEVARHFHMEGVTALLVRSPMVSLVHVDQLLGSFYGRSAAFLLLLALNWLGVIGVAAWATRRAAAKNEADARMALAAFVAHAYFTLAIQAHENHLFFALPTLAIAAATLPQYRWMLAAVSAVVALNLNLFYGFGDGVGFALPRSATLIDASVLLAIANVGVFIWHARMFAQLCGPAPRPVTG